MDTEYIREGSQEKRAIADSMKTTDPENKVPAQRSSLASDEELLGYLEARKQSLIQQIEQVKSDREALRRLMQSKQDRC